MIEFEPVTNGAAVELADRPEWLAGLDLPPEVLTELAMIPPGNQPPEVQEARARRLTDALRSWEAINPGSTAAAIARFKDNHPEVVMTMDEIRAPGGREKAFSPVRIAFFSLVGALHDLEEPALETEDTGKTEVSGGMPDLNLPPDVLAALSQVRLSERSDEIQARHDQIFGLMYGVEKNNPGVLAAARRQLVDVYPDLQLSLSERNSPGVMERMRKIPSEVLTAYGELQSWTQELAQINQAEPVVEERFQRAPDLMRLAALVGVVGSIPSSLGKMPAEEVIDILSRMQSGRATLDELPRYAGLRAAAARILSNNR